MGIDANEASLGTTILFETENGSSYVFEVDGRELLNGEPQGLIGKIEGRSDMFDVFLDEHVLLTGQLAVGSSDVRLSEYRGQVDSPGRAGPPLRTISSLEIIEG